MHFNRNMQARIKGRASRAVVTAKNRKKASDAARAKPARPVMEIPLFSREKQSQKSASNGSIHLTTTEITFQLAGDLRTSEKFWSQASERKRAHSSVVPSVLPENVEIIHSSEFIFAALMLSSSLCSCKHSTGCETRTGKKLKAETLLLASEVLSRSNISPLSHREGLEAWL